ncbi:MAG: NAD(P)/FAD-dependent oxidoreductase [Candidatus Omnitrophica bacterium]|nr:NAD(P)/FAD-dependent oxidoreductase [Candidatus Omnitrophota bacterium]MBU1128282.1 NAD(P)/FAD-dependent oxidoreductase [Candidatus Omnitrophota bacterium]MBU1784037.1 NAD(P)/FAD-dependent oxidoreductase [Candidatus Omnitrophota bacterium]MBU1851032.1 NAD(P)/FAD-dependent oxidoreductase [Candidatus Omnitrophota bacterium]
MIVIVGGGPSGMMAAISAASNNNEVTLIEKNEHLGRKLLLTGGGRCNLTNICEPEELIHNFSKTGNFLRNAFKTFDNKDLILFFAERGLKTKVEEDGRVFPVTDKALSVLDLLEEELKRSRIKVLVNTSVKKINVSQDAVTGVLCKNGTIIEADKVIVATGGLSYKATGSTGDGIKLAEELGHRIIPVKPALAALTLKSIFPERLEGISLNDVKLIVKADKKKVMSEKGSIIFTKNGISGPITLSASSKVIDCADEGKKVSLEIDIMPMLDQKEFEEVLIKKISGSSVKTIKNVLKEFAPTRLGDLLLELSRIPQDKKANQLTSKERKDLIMLLKGLKFDIKDTVSLEKAQVTRGGVSVKEIDPTTMESKKVKGLYFAGEMIDIDGNCGGFNLQAAFSTGYLAGL